MRVLALLLPLVLLAIGVLGAPLPPPLINEMLISVDGIDCEFIELVTSSPNSPFDVTLLEVECDSSSGPGTIDRVFSLSGTTDGNGLWTSGNAQFSTCFPSVVLDDSTITLFENSAATYLLVSDFSGSVGQDLDTDNDGVLDVTPWTQVIDSVCVVDGGADDVCYSTTSVGPDGFFHPPGIARMPDYSGDWVMLDFFDLSTYSPGELNSPGATPSPSASPSVSPTPSPSTSPSVSPTPSPSTSPSVSPTPSPSTSPTPSVSPTPFASPSPSPSPTPFPAAAVEIIFESELGFTLSRFIRVFIRLGAETDFDVIGNLTLVNGRVIRIEVDRTRVVGQQFLVTVEATCDGLVEVCVNGGTFSYPDVCDSINYIGCLARSIDSCAA